MIVHDGKAMPCALNQRVIVKLRYSGVKVGNARNFIWNWHKTPYPGDVVEYKFC